MESIESHCNQPNSCNPPSRLWNDRHELKYDRHRKYWINGDEFEQTNESTTTTTANSALLLAQSNDEVIPIRLFDVDDASIIKHNKHLQCPLCVDAYCSINALSRHLLLEHGIAADDISNHRSSGTSTVAGKYILYFKNILNIS